jgi:hypothetical protein
MVACAGWLFSDHGLRTPLGEHSMYNKLSALALLSLSVITSSARAECVNHISETNGSPQVAICSNLFKTNDLGKPSQSIAGRVVDHYENAAHYEAYYEPRCHTEQIPVYGGSQFSPNGSTILGGMIIGGILGKALTGDKEGAIGGAIVGGMAGGEPSQPRFVGHHNIRRCKEIKKYRQIYKREYSHSTVSFFIGDVAYSSEFVKDGMN